MVDMKTLEKEMSIFNRGFTRGHLFGDRGLAFMSMESPGNQGFPVGIVQRYDAGTGKLTLLLSDELNHNDEIQVRRKGDNVGGRVERLEAAGKVVKSCSMGETCQVNFKHACHKGEVVYKTYDEVLMKEARNTYHKEFLTIPVTMEITISQGTPVRCSLSDGVRQVWEVSEVIPQEANKRALTKEDVSDQLSKMGGTPYDVVGVQVNLEEGLALPMKVFNQLRRDLVQQLSLQRANRYQRRSQKTQWQTVSETGVASTHKNVDELTFTYSVTTLKQLERLMTLHPETIYYRDLETLEEAIDLSQRKNDSVHLVPQIHRMATEKTLKKYLNIISQFNLGTVLIQNLGHLDLFKGYQMIGDMNLNVINDLSYDYYKKQGIERITLSQELTLGQMASMNLVPRQTEVIGYGALPVMAMKHCIVTTVLGQPQSCNLCHRSRYSLVDRLDEHFPIRRSIGCFTEIYNSKTLMIVEDHEKLCKAGIGYFRLNFLDETPQELEQVVDFHHQLRNGSLQPENEAMIQLVKARGVTNGHLHRGVE